MSKESADWYRSDHDLFTNEEVLEHALETMKAPELTRSPRESSTSKSNLTRKKSTSRGRSKKGGRKRVVSIYDDDVRFNAQQCYLEAVAATMGRSHREVGK